MLISLRASPTALAEFVQVVIAAGNQQRLAKTTQKISNPAGLRFIVVHCTIEQITTQAQQVVTALVVIQIFKLLFVEVQVAC